MRRFFALVLLPALLMGWLFYSDTSTVKACSGPQSTFDGILERSEYVVRGHALEIDEAGQNFIMEAEEYLVGGAGSQYLLIDRTNPLIVESHLVDNMSQFACVYMKEEMALFRSFYVFVRRADDGTYHPQKFIFQSEFPTPESVTTIYRANGDDSYEYVEQNVTEAELRALIQEAHGDSPVAPNPDSLYPLKAPLHIETTEDKYIFPVDWQTPVLITEPYSQIDDEPGVFVDFEGYSSIDERCVNTGQERLYTSPNRLNKAVVFEDDFICFNSSGSRAVDGDTLLYAPTSDTFAIWDNCEITIYATGYRRFYLSRGSGMYSPNTTELAAESCTQFHEQAVWSPDGRLLAFADRDGIYLWDVYTERAEPRLILDDTHDELYTPTGPIGFGESRQFINSDIERSQMLVPLNFSAGGRYLRYTDGNTRYHYDIQGNMRYEDGIISPDERILIQFDTTQSASASFERCSLTPFDCRGGRINVSLEDENGSMMTHQFSDIQEGFWKNAYTFMVFTCESDTYSGCVLAELPLDSLDILTYSITHPAVDFTWDAANHTLTVLRDESTLAITNYTVNVGQWFDENEDIIAIEWLPSIFYHAP